MSNLYTVDQFSKNLNLNKQQSIENLPEKDCKCLIQFKKYSPLKLRIHIETAYYKSQTKAFYENQKSPWKFDLEDIQAYQII